MSFHSSCNFAMFYASKLVSIVLLVRLKLFVGIDKCYVLALLTFCI